MANATLFIFIFSSQIGNETSTLYIQYFAWGLLGGVDGNWSRGLLVLICIDVIVVRVKVSRGFVPLPNGVYKAASISSAPLHPRIFFRFITIP